MLKTLKLKARLHRRHQAQVSGSRVALRDLLARL